MTKLESAELIIKQDGGCRGLYCGDNCCLKGYCSSRTIMVKKS